VATDDPASATSVLLVDDNADNLLALGAVLERLHLRLVEATSGERALAVAEQQEFAVIVLDVQMPGLDGFQTARLLRARSGGEHTPIIFLTANSHDPGISLRGYAEGAVDFLSKPFDPAVLRSKVSVFVLLFEARRTVQRQGTLLREAALEAQRRESEARYHSLAEAVPQVVCTTDVNGTVTYANRAWMKSLGVLPGQSGQWEDIIHPEDFGNLQQGAEKALSEGVVLESLYRLRSVDGTYRWHLCQAVPTRDAQGQLTGWLGTGTDVDVQRRREQRSGFLAEASNALGASLELREVLSRVCALAVPAAVDLCAVHLRRHGASLQEVTAVPAVREALDRSGPEGLDGLGIGEVLATGTTVSGSGAASAAGRLGLAHAISVPLVSRGELLGVLTLGRLPGADPGIYSDELAHELAGRVALAADNARLYEDAQEAIHLRDEFLSVASHELRTPLTPLNLKLGMVRRLAEQAGAGTLPAEQVAADIVIAARHVQRLTNLVDHLLDVTRIRAGRLQLQLELVDLADVVRDTVARLVSVGAETGSLIAVETPERCTGIWDRMRLEQITTNLLTNALKYGAGRPVQIQLAEEGAGRVVLSVRDRGLGMERSVLERIFGRFERGHSGRHYPGLGLGLYITRQIVTALEGTIEVESAPGEGSVFKVVLPRARSELGASGTTAPRERAEADVGPPQGARGA
jgi:PAS domain S-box-containing protein